MKTVSLAISGMTCDGCAATVKRVIARVPGVTGAEVALREGRATVRGDDALDAKGVIAAVASAGFGAKEA
jgi:copper chaperone CopZ